jgi:DNA-binding transcriptional MerR regulator
MDQHMSVHRIGALAAAAGVTVDTLRYYEREGLLPPASRTAGGFRLYSPDIAQRLQFIKRAQQLGLTLREIRQLVQPENCRCSAVRDVITERLADVERRLRELVAFRKTLRKALARCDETLGRSKRAACPVAKRLESGKLRAAG